jgi:formiminoglutamase
VTAPPTFRPPAPPPLPRVGDPRVGHLLAREAGDETRVVLLGFPCDLGVKLNRGRAGSSLGPTVLRDALYRLTPDPRLPAHRLLLERTADLGDLELAGNLAEDQERLGRAVAPHLEAGRLPIVLGGGHETAYGHFLAHVYAGTDRASPIQLLNWDAHPDVRPLEDGHGHSGSPFRQALEHPSRRCERYDVAGLLPHAVAAEHLQYLETHRSRIWWRHEIHRETVDEIYRDRDAPLMVSFDLDGIDESAAPGVSAPGAGGLDPALWLRAAEAAGAAPTLASADVVELNPLFDHDGRTARLAALTVWMLLRGHARRT